MEQRKLIDKMMREHVNTQDDEDVSKGLYNKDKKTIETAASQGREIVKEAIYDWVKSERVGEESNNCEILDEQQFPDENPEHSPIEFEDERNDDCELKNNSIPSELLQRLRKCSYLNDQEVNYFFT